MSLNMTLNCMDRLVIKEVVRFFLKELGLTCAKAGKDSSYLAILGKPRQYQQHLLPFLCRVKQSLCLAFYSLGRLAAKKLITHGSHLISMNLRKLWQYLRIPYFFNKRPPLNSRRPQIVAHTTTSVYQAKL